MPIVNILITREGTSPGQSATTAEEKTQLIKGVSDLLLEVLGKPLNSTFVTIHEVEMENWGIGGLPTPEFRKRRDAPIVPPHSEPRQTRGKPGVGK